MRLYDVTEVETEALVVLEEKVEPDSDGQIWTRGKSDAYGWFTLKNSKSGGVMTHVKIGVPRTYTKSKVYFQLLHTTPIKIYPFPIINLQEILAIKKIFFQTQLHSYQQSFSSPQKTSVGALMNLKCFQPIVQTLKRGLRIARWIAMVLVLE